MLTIGREGKRQEFETDLGSPEHLYRKGGKRQRFETENQEVLNTYTNRGKEVWI